MATMSASANGAPPPSAASANPAPLAHMSASPSAMARLRDLPSKARWAGVAMTTAATSANAKKASPDQREAGSKPASSIAMGRCPISAPMQ